MAAYVERYSGCPAVVIHPPIYGGRPLGNLRVRTRSGHHAQPLRIKGNSIFLELARRLPIAVRGAAGLGHYGGRPRGAGGLPQRKLLPQCSDIRDLLRRTRVLLMPSLWYEGFGLIVMQAMLHGIPVVASDSGGLAEAKAGTAS